jgi:hypothetical protein
MSTAIHVTIDCADPGREASDHRGAIEEDGEFWVRMSDPEGNEFCVQ